MKKVNVNLQNPAAEFLKENFGICAKKDTFWTGQLAIGLSMVSQEAESIAEKFRSFRYSKHGIRRNGKPLAPEFDGLEAFEEVIKSVGAIGIAAHKHAAVCYFPSGNPEDMEVVGRWCQREGAGNPWETYGNKVFID